MKEGKIEMMSRERNFLFLGFSAERLESMIRYRGYDYAILRLCNLDLYTWIFSLKANHPLPK
jgi:hypothetical protein